jgi:hypothetical protein
MSGTSLSLAQTSQTTQETGCLRPKEHFEQWYAVCISQIQPTPAADSPGSLATILEMH